MNIRAVTPEDHDAIAAMVRAAFLAEFGRSSEAELTDQVRALGEVVREAVADEGGEIVGHILFSRAYIETEGARHPAVQLGPVCAAVGRQKRGIGAALIREGLAALDSAGETHVFLLGHGGYYPRFGFSADAARAFDAPWNGPHHMLRLRGDGGPDAGRLIVSKAFG